MVYLIVAASIALMAFVIRRAFPGLGVALVAVASTAWVAYSTKRQKNSNRTR